MTAVSRWVRFRIYAVAVLFVGLLGAVGYKAWTVQIRDGARMHAMGRAQYAQSMAVPGPRGTIRDANGVELAVSVEVDSVFANPREIADPARAARSLAVALGVDRRALEARLRADRGFVWVRRRISPEAAARVRALGLAGVELVEEPKRFYPGRELGGTVIGFAGLDGKGLDGLEMSLDESLRGRSAEVPALRDARGQLLLAGGYGDPQVAGATVTLTIDRFVQFVAERALADTLREHKAKAGMVVVLDAPTGDVLALATLPTFDPNDPGRRGDARNRTITDAYEPGSVMKVFSIAAAVDAGVVTPSSIIDIEGGRMQIGSKTITDTHHGEYGVTVTRVMQVSSNVGAAKIARKLGKERLHEALLRFGFGARTGVELPGERSGVVRDPKRWGEIGLATGAFGYGMTVTPLQVAAALTAIAGDGRWITPGVVKEIRSADGQVAFRRTPVKRPAFQARTARQVRDMMKTVCEEGGTAAHVVVPGFKVAGKTGTAHKVDPATGRYADDRYLASFVGMVPADDPRLIIVVMIDDPRGEKHFGGSVAGPTFARIAEESLKYLGVAATEPMPPPGAPRVAAAGRARAAAPAPVGDDVVMTDLADPAAPPSAVATEVDEGLPPAGPGEPIVLIPDFTGMSMGQALATARTAGVRVELEGSGRAARQFPPPGRALRSVTCKVSFEPG